VIYYVLDPEGERYTGKYLSAPIALNAAVMKFSERLVMTRLRRGDCWVQMKKLGFKLIEREADKR
jgi:hypothetical protein